VAAPSAETGSKVAMAIIDLYANGPDES
jgi:hypothetical protein